MSLTMLAARIAAVEALKAANTSVGRNVLDSQISAFDHTATGQLSTDQQRPFVAVYTDSAKTAELGSSGLRANGAVDFLFNCGVTIAMSQTNKETGESEIVEGYPATDPIFETILDVLDMQICRALVDDQSPWAQVFGGFVCRFVAKELLRSSGKVDGVRLAAGQVKITAELWSDPPLGQGFPEGSPWARFLAMMAEYELPQLPLFQSFLGSAHDGLYPEFERLIGVTTRHADAMRLYTFGGLERNVIVTDTTSNARVG